MNFTFHTHIAKIISYVRSFPQHRAPEVTKKTEF